MTGGNAVPRDALLNHTDLYHVFLHATDVEAAMALLSEHLGLNWLPVMRGTYSAWVPDGQAFTAEAVTVYSKEGPVYVELGHFPVGPMPTATDLVNPHHFGYWCDDVPSTKQALQDSDWKLEFEVGREVGGPTGSYLRSPAGLLVELVPRAIKERFEAYTRSAAQA
ncbi:VOC family protein [Jatrophihabitans cynanchi]|uniref:VOC family protein n=1 Tax=Jatrophihabitans cynanchi TaxID=2944128 RepID=A0ABY7K0Z2_9ACTN|nr:VOC family protein [Jatrophihabitans sp. SB3-54]WAX58482.1 VOC family protein [Jatrophihabitans sp. SB3-54]